MESVDSPGVQTRSGAPDDLVSHTNDLQCRHRLRPAGGNAGKLPAREGLPVPLTLCVMRTSLANGV